jgi:hypothetical protein
MKTASVYKSRKQVYKFGPTIQMKRLLLLLLCLLIGTRAYRLRNSPNGPADDLGFKILDDDGELDKEDGPQADFPPIGDILEKQEAEVEPGEPEFEDYGELMEDPSFAASLVASIQSMFNSPDEKIISEPGQTADCYALDYVKCEFSAEEEPVVWVIEYDDTPAEYHLTVERSSPDTAVMRRRLKADDCSAFSDIFMLWNREIACEIKEYAHKISIKHIG